MSAWIAVGIIVLFCLLVLVLTKPMKKSTVRPPAGPLPAGTPPAGTSLPAPKRWWADRELVLTIPILLVGTALLHNLYYTFFPQSWKTMWTVHLGTAVLAHILLLLSFGYYTMKGLKGMSAAGSTAGASAPAATAATSGSFLKSLGKSKFADVCFVGLKAAIILGILYYMFYIGTDRLRYISPHAAAPTSAATVAMTPVMASPPSDPALLPGAQVKFIRVPPGTTNSPPHERSVEVRTVESVRGLESLWDVDWRVVEPDSPAVYMFKNGDGVEVSPGTTNITKTISVQWVSLGTNAVTIRVVRTPYF